MTWKLFALLPMCAMVSGKVCLCPEQWHQCAIGKLPWWSLGLSVTGRSQEAGGAGGGGAALEPGEDQGTMPRPS